MVLTSTPAGIGDQHDNDDPSTTTTMAHGHQPPSRGHHTGSPPCLMSAGTLTSPGLDIVCSLHRGPVTVTTKQQVLLLTPLGLNCDLIQQQQQPPRPA